MLVSEKEYILADRPAKEMKWVIPFIEVAESFIHHEIIERSISEFEDKFEYEDGGWHFTFDTSDVVPREVLNNADEFFDWLDEEEPDEDEIYFYFFNRAPDDWGSEDFSFGRFPC